MKTNNLKGSLILGAAALIWGLAFVAQSSAADSIPPFIFNFLRSYIGAAALFIFVLIRDRKNNTPLIPQEKKEKYFFLKGGIFCGTMLAVSVNFQQFGIAAYPDHTATEARAGFITALYVILVPLFSIFARKKISVNVWLGVLIALCGIYMLCLTGGVSTIYAGDLLMFICALSFSFHIMLVDKFVTLIDGVKLSMIQFLVCGTFSLILSLCFELHSISLSGILEAAFQILYLGIMSSGVAYTLQIIGQKYAEPTIASITMSFESVFAALGGCLISGNTLSSRELLGCIFVFAAIIVSQLPPLKFKKSNIKQQP